MHSNYRLPPDLVPGIEWILILGLPMTCSRIFLPSIVVVYFQVVYFFISSAWPVLVLDGPFVLVPLAFLVILFCTSEAEALVTGTTMADDVTNLSAWVVNFISHVETP